MARLDRLAPVKEVAQIAACIGREFGHELLAAVAELQEEQLRGALDQLVAAQLVFRRGTPPEAVYTFKHGLVQDAAYQSLLKGRRQQFHARIVRFWSSASRTWLRHNPRSCARHCVEARLIEKAITYWYQAGRQAMARSAMAEAMTHLSHGLGLLGELSDEVTRLRLRVDLQVALAGTLSAAKGWAAEETGEALSRARELCRDAGDIPQLFPLMMGQWSFHLNRIELSTAREIAEELLGLGQRHGDLEALMMGHRAVGTSLLHLGELIWPVRILERANER